MKCKKLRLFFIEFLLDFSNMENIAIQQLRLLDQDSLSLEEFLIYIRLEYKAKKTILKKNDIIFLEEISVKENSSKLDSELKNLIEKALLHNSLMLGTLREDVVDIPRLYNTIKTSHKSIKKCMKFWKKHRLIDRRNLGSKLVYGVFLKEVLHMENEGNKIIDDFHEKKKRKVERSHKIANIKFDEIEKILKMNSAPLCLLKKSGLGEIKIKNCNKEFAKILMKEKKYLVGENFENFVGKFTKKFYLDLMKQKGLYQHGKRFTLSFKISKKIFKIIGVEIRVLRKIDESYAILKVNSRSHFKPQGDILTDLSGKIYGVSFTCMSIFGWKNLSNLDCLKHLKNISKKFENFNFSENSNFIELSKKVKLRADLRDMSDSNLKWIKITRYYNGFFKTATKLKKTMSEFKNSDIRLWEKMLKHYKDFSVTGNNCFEFCINEKIEIEGKSKRFSLDYFSRLRDKKIELIKEKVKMKKFSREILKASYNTCKIPKYDYGEGIKVKRLVNGYIRDIADFSKNDDFSDLSHPDIGETESTGKSIFAKSTTNKEIKSGSEKKLKKLKKIFQKKFLKYSKTQKLLISLAITFSLLTITHQIYVNQNNKLSFNRVKLLNEISNTAGIRNAAVMGISLKLQDLMLANQGFDFTTIYDKNWSMEEYKKECMNYIEFYYKDYVKYQNKLVGLYRSFHNPKTIQELEWGKYTELILKEEKKNYVFWDSQNILYAMTAKVLEYKPEEITRENEDVKFLFQNILKVFLVRFPKANAVRFVEIDTLLEEMIKFYHLNFFILSARKILLLVFSFIITKLVYREVEKQVKIFLGFDSRYLTRMLKLNINFLKKMEKCLYDDEEQFFDDLDEKNRRKNRNDSRDKENESEIDLRRKKRSKGTIVPFVGFIFFLFLLFIIINFYSSETSYLRNGELIQKGIGYAVSFRTILVSDSILHLCQVLLHMLFYKEDFVFYEKPAKGYLDGYMPYSHQLIGEFYFVIFF